MTRYHSFTCPECGSHLFGTHKYHEVLGTKYKHLAPIGKCHENQHSGNGCKFEWDRDDPVAEASCMHEQTAEEWKITLQGVQHD